METIYLVMQKWPKNRPWMPESAHSSREAAQERIEQLTKWDAIWGEDAVDYQITEVPHEPQRSGMQ